MPKVALDEQLLLWTIDHVTKYGDNDIFPPVLELEFFKSKRIEVAASLAQIDLHQHRPISLTESLVPKSKVGFRLGHQIYPSDAILFTAATITIAGDIESHRSDSAFSYRFHQQPDGNLFSAEHRYRDWLHTQKVVLGFDGDVDHVVTTDIADFYGRIYHHRLENCLVDYAGESAFSAYILKCIRDWRSRQSFGLPVGGNAARILAEALLCDVDNALRSHGWKHSRYVDDIVIHVRKGQDPYVGLAFLAEQLSTSEGLSLNSQKTRIWSKVAYLEKLDVFAGETAEEAEEGATEQLFWDAYGQEEPDEEALAELKARDLLGELDKELEQEPWNSGRIKVLLYAVRLTKPLAAAGFVRSRFADLLPFIKEVALLMRELTTSGDASFSGEGGLIVSELLGPRAMHLPMVRAWLWYLLVNEVVAISLEEVNQLSRLDHVLDRRGEYLLRMKLKDLTFFRRQKSRIDELSPWLQPVLLYSSKCLPRDEYRTWIGNVRGRLRFPLPGLFCDWCLELADTQ